MARATSSEPKSIDYEGEVRPRKQDEEPLVPSQLEILNNTPALKSHTLLVLVLRFLISLSNARTIDSQVTEPSAGIHVGRIALCGSEGEQ